MATRPARDLFADVGSGLAPNFSLIISGKDTGEAAELYEAVRPLVASITFEDDEEMSSMFELRLINQPESVVGQPVNWRAVIDSKAFAEGNYVDVRLGYGSALEFVDRVEIVKWMPSFPETGPATFTVKGYDGRHRMMIANEPKRKGGLQKDVAPPRIVGGKARKAKKSKGARLAAGGRRKTFYKNSPDEIIVKQIADKYGFGVETDSTEVKKKAVVGKGGKAQQVIRTRGQAPDMSDWEFLRKLAEINRFDLWVDWSEQKKQWVIHFKRKVDAGQAIYRFTYNGEDGSLISAEPDFSVKEQATAVEVLYYDRKKRSVEHTVVSESGSGEDVSLAGGRVGPGQLQAKKTISPGAMVRFSAFGQTIEAFADRPFSSAKDANSFVQAWLKERERDFLIMQGRVVGVQSLRCRQIHELAGLGARLDGFYRFTNVKHVMEPGRVYVCEFVAHKVLSEEIAQRKVTSGKVKSS
jgi:phage protein D